MFDVLLWPHAQSSLKLFLGLWAHCYLPCHPRQVLLRKKLCIFVQLACKAPDSLDARLLFPDAQACLPWKKVLSVGLFKRLFYCHLMKLSRAVALKEL